MKKTLLVLLLLGLWAGTAPSVCCALTDSAETSFRPWSGYWWPTTGGGLANGYGKWGRPAPLEKFEMLTIGAYPGLATQWELQNYYDPNAPHWYGQCHAWAAAAAYENIAFYPSSYNNIVFRVGDKKGLLSACHGSDLAVRASAGYSPHVFHEWLLDYIKVQGKAFVADLGGPEEAWFYPLFKYEMQLTPGGGQVGVVCRVWYASDLVDPDIQGTEVLTKTFTYTLYLNGSKEITGGEWTGGSVTQHPKSMFFPLAPQATNPYLDYAVIRAVAVHRDDFLEGDEPVRLLPGAYNLILLNEDVYTLEGRPGDTFFLDLERLDDFEEGMQVLLQDADGRTVWEAELEDSLSRTLEVANPPYRLTVDRDSYGGGGIYKIWFDIRKPHEILIPEIQKGSAWNGVAMTNTSENAIAGIQVVTYDGDSRPVATVKGPYGLGPLEKDVWLTEGLPMRLHETAPVRMLKVLTDDPLALIYLGGLDRRHMSSYGQRQPAIPTMIFPDMSGLFDVNKYVSWGLVNKGAGPVALNCRLYSRDGFLDKEISLTLSANSVARYSPDQNPFYRALDNGWVSVRVPPGALGSVEGFFRWGKDGNGGAESLFPLSQRGTLLYVPHVACDDAWKTGVTLINLSDTVNVIECRLMDQGLSDAATLTLFPFEKVSYTVDDLFPSVAAHEVSRSAMKITGETVFTGWFDYRTPGSSAAFELMSADQISGRFVIPHIASDAYWWTGVALCNPWEATETVTLTPVDGSGNPVPVAAATLSVPPRSKDIFLLESIFDEAVVNQTAWIRITSSGNGVMGLFIYGDRDMGVSSGAALFHDPAAGNQ